MSLLPHCITNLVKSVDAASRIILKTTEGVERIVDGADQLATIALKKTHDEMLRELTAAQDSDIVVIP